MLTNVELHAFQCVPTIAKALSDLAKAQNKLVELEEKRLALEEKCLALEERKMNECITPMQS